MSGGGRGRQWQESVGSGTQGHSGTQDRRQRPCPAAGARERRYGEAAACAACF